MEEGERLDAELAEAKERMLNFIKDNIDNPRVRILGNRLVENLLEKADAAKEHHDYWANMPMWSD